MGSKPTNARWNYCPPYFSHPAMKEKNNSSVGRLPTRPDLWWKLIQRIELSLEQINVPSEGDWHVWSIVIAKEGAISPSHNPSFAPLFHANIPPKWWPRRLDVPPTLNYFCPSSQYKLKADNWKLQTFLVYFSFAYAVMRSHNYPTFSSVGPEFWNAPVRHVSLQCFCLRSNWCPVPQNWSWSRHLPTEDLV